MLNERPADTDTIYVNGRIHAVDAKNSIFEAVAVGEGRILATGSSAAILSDDPLMGRASLKDIRVEETIVAGSTVHRAA